MKPSDAELSRVKRELIGGEARSTKAPPESRSSKWTTNLVVGVVNGKLNTPSDDGRQQ